MLIAACLLLLHATLTAYGPKPRELRFQNLEQQNQYAIERYFSDPTRSSLAFVGSSLSARLFLPGGIQCGHDLALQGESSLTGLSVITRTKPKPGLVLVEINVPERKPNFRLIESANGFLARHFEMFAVQNKPVNLLFGFLYQLRGEAAKPRVDEGLLAEGVAIEQGAYAIPIRAELLSENMRSLADQVRSLEAAGSQVKFFELPIHPSLENSPRARQIRTAFAASFPRHVIISSQQLAQGIRIRTVDGIHLAEDEAGAVAQRLGTYQGGACAGSPRGDLRRDIGG